MNLDYYQKESLISALYSVSCFLDALPSYSFRHRVYLLRGSWGYRMGVSSLAAWLDRRWEIYQ